MLDPDVRRILLDELRPPDESHLDAAVATTFTLDLAAALVPPLAFASFHMRSTTDPVAALEAVRSCTDRVDVFCQTGQLSIPAQATDLMTFLEPMVHPVRRPRSGHLFHPKIWVLRYTSEEGEPRYRFLCLTRNLTEDHSWDLVLRLDGTLSGGPRAGNRPLSDLIRSLPMMAVQPLARPRVERIEQLAEDVRRVEWERPPDVKDIAFHVYGIGRNPKPDFSGYRHLVVAPFLNDRGLRTVAPAGGTDVTVVSRVEELERLSQANVETIRSMVVSAIAGLEEESELTVDQPRAAKGLLSGLHAKFYVVERNRAAHLFIGSANATDAAFGGNVEILVELTGGATRLGVETFLSEDSPFRTLLEDYDAEGGSPEDPDAEAERILEDLVRDLAAVPFRLAVSASGDNYRLDASTRSILSLPPGYAVTVELLTRPGTAGHVASGQVLDCEFDGVPLADITPFLALRAKSSEGLERGAVIRAALINDPDGRLDEVLARQVDTPEKFMRFLTLLLGLGNPHLLAMLAGSESGKGGSAAALGPAPGVFEMVLRALADHPDSVEDLDRLVQRLVRSEQGRGVLPPGFEDLWRVVTQAHEHLTTTGAR